MHKVCSGTNQCNDPSSISLYRFQVWLSIKKELPVFVKNLVLEINKHINVTYSYVNINEKTRGTSVEILKENELWSILAK